MTWLHTGAPPEGHPRQCRARSRVTRQRCRRWALRSSNYCQFHGGRRSVLRRKKLPSVYSKYLGPKLSERVSELLAESHDKQVSLYDELAIARATACEALKLASPLWEDPEKASTLNTETRALMMSTLQQAMSNVKDLVLAASKVEKDAEDKVSMKVINLVVQQIVLAVHGACGPDNAELAKKIADAIDEHVRLPMSSRAFPTVKVRL